MRKNSDNFNSRVKDFFEDKKLTKYSVFIICTFTILFIIMSLIRNIGTVLPAAGSAVGWFLGLFASFFIGIVIAYIINPLVNFINRKTPLENMRAGRGISILLTYVIILAAIFLLLYGFVALILGKLVIGSLPDLFNTLVSTFRSYEQSITNWVSNLPKGTFSDGIQSIVNKVLKWITESFSGESIISSVSGIVGGVVNIVIGIMFSIYILLDKDTLIDFWNGLLDLLFPKRKERLNKTLHEIDDILTSFIKGIAIDASIVAIFSAAVLKIVGIKFGVFLGLFAGICNVIPYFGPFIGMIPAFLVGTITTDVTHGIIAVLAMFVVQQFDANLIYPKVVGNQTGLSALYVLLAVTVGGGVGGLLGMVLAVPVAGVIKLFFDKFVAMRKASVLEQRAADDNKTSTDPAASVADEKQE